VDSLFFKNCATLKCIYLGGKKLCKGSLELNCKNDSQPIFQHFEGLKKGSNEECDMASRKDLLKSRIFFA
jgi:hypothetical protein